MAKVNKTTEILDVQGAKRCKTDIELDIDASEVYDIIREKIEDGELDYIPSELTVTVSQCLDKECWDTVEYEFDIDPYDYLDDKDIEELEALIEKDTDE